jgi:hypothetical protein
MKKWYDYFGVNRVSEVGSSEKFKEWLKSRSALLNSTITGYSFIMGESRLVISAQVNYDKSNWLFIYDGPMESDFLACRAHNIPDFSALEKAFDASTKEG